MGRYEQWADEVIGKIREKMSWSSEKNKDHIPYSTDGAGNYIPSEYGLSWWTNGFWGGSMWLMYQDTGEKRYMEYARKCGDSLNRCFDDFYGLNHDVGFMYMPTAVADYRLTGNEESKKRGLHAANLLAGRFNPVGRFIRAWDWSGENDVRGWAIIDCMCNLSLLYWASEETGDPRYRHVAVMHADTARKHFVREDGSVRHIIEFNPDTGEYIRSHGGQGYGHGSSWTRGHGWAVYGFMISYLHTRKEDYLETARKVADYCIANIPESGLIPVDFRQPAEPAWEDSCGASIMAGGLIELARALGEAEGEKYLQAAWKILNTIYEKRADFSHGCDAIVQNCSAAYHDKVHHFPMSYGDYYFIESVYKLKGIGMFMW